MKKKTAKKNVKKSVVKGNGKPVKANKTVKCDQCINPHHDGLCECDDLSGLAARESESEWWSRVESTDHVEKNNDLPEHSRPLKIKTSRSNADTNSYVKTSDPEWFANWKPKTEKPKNTGIPILTDIDRDDVLTEFARIIESRPQSLMDGLERDVANKTKLFLLAKRELLESKQKLELAYSKFISDVKLDKDPLIDEIK